MEHSFNFFMHISAPSILLLVIVFSFALVGTVAAAEDSYAVRNISQAYVIPYGYLPSGTPVTSGFSLNVIGVYPSGGEEDFFTDLVHPNWSYTIVVNGVENIRPVVSGSTFAISGFELTYRPSDVVTVRVMVEGEAPVVDSPLKNFTVVKAQSLFGNGTVIPGSIVTIERQTAATQPPVSDFTAHPTSGAPPLTVSFWDASVNYPSSWNWSFGDGTWFNFSGLVPLNPIHSYSGYGTYTVTLTTSNAIGTSTTTKGDFINVSASTPPLIPLPNFTTNVTTGNAPLSVQFNDTSIGWPEQWVWNFGDGNYSTEQNPVHMYAYPGHFMVQLRTSNRYGGGTTYRYIDVFSISIANFTGTPLSGTAPLTVSFTDSSSGNPNGWAWYFGDEDYSAPWSLINSSAGWSARSGHTSVAMPDGSIVLMGGYRGDAFLNDTWRSTDNGSTWIQVNASAGWTARDRHSSVAMPDGSIVLMGGEDGGIDYYTNDTWRSTDYGATWMQMNASAGWTRRTVHTSVAMADGSIVLMGGFDNYGGLKNDVWRSTDAGATWIQMNASAGWTGRTFPCSVAMPDGSIVLMGGYLDGAFLNDVWRSTDSGATWTQVTPRAEWSKRSEFASVAMPDGSIVLMGGYDGSFKNDVWRSTDDGATWIRVNASAGWTGRIGHTSMVMPDGSIILIGGRDRDGLIYNNEVWRFDPVTSAVQNPSHTYPIPGTYQVALQAYNTGGYNSTRKNSYITVYPSVDSGSSSSEDITSLIITPGKTITQTLNVGGGSAVTRAELTGTNLGRNLVITAFPQDNLPSTIAVPQTTVYQYISITSSTIPGVVNQTTLDFRIPKAWLTEHDFTAGDIVMIHYDNMQWQALDTMYVSQNSGNVFYRATTEGFSYFAIVYQKGGTDIGTGTPVVTPVQPVTDNAVVPVTDANLTIPITTEKTQVVPPAPVIMPSEAIPLTTIIAGGIGVVAIITGAFLIRRWWIRTQNPALFLKDK